MIRIYFLIFHLILLGLIIGQILTVVKFCKCDFEPSYKAEIVYAATFVTGIGGITGYFNFGK